MEGMHDGIIEEWAEVNGVIYGTLYYDSKGRFEDGTQIKTSKVIAPELNTLGSTMTIQTKNSTYVLGMKAGDSIDD